MSVYRPKGSLIYKYDFWFAGERYRESTGLRDKGDAERVEWRLKERLALEAQGIAPVDPAERSVSPRIHEWVDVVLGHKTMGSAETRALKRPDLLERTLRIACRFCGSLPE